MTAVATAVVAGSAITSYASSRSADKAAANQAAAIDAQTAISDRQMDMAEEEYDFYKENYRPLELEILADAGVSEEEVNQEVAAAGLTTSNAYDSSIAQRERNLQRMGINPNSGAYAESSRKNAISKAVAKANSQNSARSTAQSRDYAEKVAALGLGKGATDSVGSLMSSASSGYNSASAGYGTQMQAYGQSAASTMNLGMQLSGAALGAGTTADGSFNWSQFGSNLTGA